MASSPEANCSPFPYFEVLSRDLAVLVVVGLMCVISLHEYYERYDYFQVYCAGYSRAWRNAKIATKYRIIKTLAQTKDCDQVMVVKRLIKEWDAEIDHYLPEADEISREKGSKDPFHDIWYDHYEEDMMESLLYKLSKKTRVYKRMWIYQQFEKLFENKSSYKDIEKAIV
ncbi:hypothetical protein ACHAP3_011227 [Botrytis cinerea]